MYLSSPEGYSHIATATSSPKEADELADAVARTLVTPPAVAIHIPDIDPEDESPLAADDEA
jgi:hypothetical protein